MNAIKLSDRYRSKEVFQKSVNVEIPSGRCILFSIFISNKLRVEDDCKVMEVNV